MARRATENRLGVIWQEKRPSVTTTMTILATNKATKRSKIWNVLDIVSACILVPSILLLIHLSWKIYQETNSFSFGTFFCAAWALIVLYVVLVIIDNYLRWTRGVESVKVDNGMLVIDCEGSILRRHKRIPLSSICEVKQYGDIEIIRGVYAPDRLKVFYYSDIRRYRFGMCLGPAKHNALATKIMALAEESKRKEEAAKRMTP